MSFFVHTLFPCTGFGFEVAAEWAFDWKSLLSNHQYFWGLGTIFWLFKSAQQFASLYLCSNPHVLLKCFCLKKAKQVLLRCFIAWGGKWRFSCPALCLWLLWDKHALLKCQLFSSPSHRSESLPDIIFPSRPPGQINSGGRAPKKEMCHRSIHLLSCSPFSWPAMQ